jgi:hypothetical protein
MNQEQKPENIVLDEEGQKRFLDLARKVVTAPAPTEEQMQAEREYMAKNFTSKGKRRVGPKS